MNIKAQEGQLKRLERKAIQLDKAFGRSKRRRRIWRSRRWRKFEWQDVKLQERYDNIFHAIRDYQEEVAYRKHLASRSVTP